MKQVLSIVGLLSTSYLYALFLVMPEWNQFFGYSADSTFLIQRQAISVFIAIAVLTAMIRFKSSISFGKFGIGLFGISTLLLLSMFILPNTLVPTVEAKKLYININGISIYPMLFYIVGVLLLVGYLYEKLSAVKLNLTIIGLMGLSVFFTLSFHDYGNFLLLELFLLSLLVYLNGFTKYTIGAIVGILTIGILYILSAPHRMARLKNWFNATSIVQDNNPLNMGSLSLLDAQFDVVFVVFMLIIYIALIYTIMKYFLSSANNKLLPFGVVSLLSISLGLNILDFLHCLPVNPTPLFFFDYGLSITVVSYMFIGLLSLASSKK